VGSSCLQANSKNLQVPALENARDLNIALCDVLHVAHNSAPSTAPALHGFAQKHSSAACGVSVYHPIHFIITWVTVPLVARHPA
jgi:hypothetical protein